MPVLSYPEGEPSAEPWRLVRREGFRGPGILRKSLLLIVFVDIVLESCFAPKRSVILSLLRGRVAGVSCKSIPGVSSSSAMLFLERFLIVCAFDRLVFSLSVSVSAVEPSPGGGGGG